MKDFLDNSIKVGDRVVYHTNQCNPQLRKGVVKSINEFTGWLEILSDCKICIKRYCTDVILIK